MDHSKGKPIKFVKKRAAAEIRSRDRSELKKKRKQDRKDQKFAQTVYNSPKPPKQVPRSLDKLREFEPSVIKDTDDVELEFSRRNDEFHGYLNGELKPKIMITTNPKPRSKIYPFIAELMDMLPNAFFYKRENFRLRDICKWASNKKFSHLCVISERLGRPNQLLICHVRKAKNLQDKEIQLGPTALFKVSNFRKCREIIDRGNRSDHLPEIILNNFSTILGDRISRFLGSLFEHKELTEDFIGRNVITFHNQRDYIFVRSHRYLFDSEFKKVKLQEIGPRFTLKLRWLASGSFDPKHADFEWIMKQKEMKSKKKFFL